MCSFGQGWTLLFLRQMCCLGHLACDSVTPAHKLHACECEDGSMSWYSRAGSTDSSVYSKTAYSPGPCLYLIRPRQQSIRLIILSIKLCTFHAMLAGVQTSFKDLFHEGKREMASNYTVRSRFGVSISSVGQCNEFAGEERNAATPEGKSCVERITGDHMRSMLEVYSAGNTFRDLAVLSSVPTEDKLSFHMRPVFRCLPFPLLPLASCG